LACELEKGKMLGVLVVGVPQPDGTEQRAFLAAYSGNLPVGLGDEYFVPNVVRLGEIAEEYAPFENEIAALSEELAQLEHSANYSTLRQQHADLHKQANATLDALRAAIAAVKTQRHAYRQQQAACAQLIAAPSYDALRSQLEEAMLRESQFLKAELQRSKQFWHAQLETMASQLGEMEEQIRTLKAQRAALSEQAQQLIFRRFPFLNALGQRRTLPDIFGTTPPSGSGECCAPKLLQYTFEQELRPICMAEFWMGESPKDEFRIAGQFYPACRHKCRPLLGFMLEGLSVEANPLLERNRQMAQAMTIIYSDAHIAVVNKPGGMLSVPGNDEVPSVKDEILRLFPQADGPIIVHRLDMETAGLMVVALTRRAYHDLQKQFAQRLVHKSYYAEVESLAPLDAAHALDRPRQGVISLPLCPNPDDRPRQLVSAQYGKEAVTHYEFASTSPPIALRLSPITGRTHQLRVHCAHPDGLGLPIVGDHLYGRPGPHLHLLAQQLSFAHPVTKEALRFEVPVPEAWK
ncbi:MAG: RNA pseudouridine synthase, partial [Bacteroidaceae bacterium]|nr:RNA pseudouridine synthase [Bacteroidaceae bacterium]